MVIESKNTKKNWQFYSSWLAALATLIAILSVLANISFNAGQLTTKVDGLDKRLSRIEEKLDDLTTIKIGIAAQALTAK